MEASVTTENRYEGEGQLHHNHGPNFGRYVEGCPICAKKFPDGKPIRKVKKPRKPYQRREEPSPSPAAQLTTEEMIEKLREAGITVSAGIPADTPQPSSETTTATLAGASLDTDTLMAAMRVLGTELRRPDPEVEAERAAQKARLKVAKEHERTVVMEAERQKKANQDICAKMGHKQNGGRSQNSAISGQMCTGDQLFHWICVSCQMTGTRKPLPDEMQMGVA